MDFIDLKSQQARLKQIIDQNLSDVLRSGAYIMGPQVGELEQKLATYMGAEYALSCANGTDALLLPMMAWQIGPGDAVFCPSFTYCASAEAIALIGATPVFVDVEKDTFNICPASLEKAISDITDNSALTPRAVMVVDLFGQSADYPRLAPIARAAGLKILSDSAQAFGTTLDGNHPLHWCDAATTSFYPAKPLGCYGDGGAVFTNESALANAIKSLRNHGQGTDKYDNVRIGLNSRLDTIQAAVLLAKLTIFDDELKIRNAIAERYSAAFENQRILAPIAPSNIKSSWAQYTVCVENPDHFAAILRDAGIPTARYYPTPIHMQTAYKSYPVAPGGLPNTEHLMQRVISLPMHAYLTEDQQDRIIEASLGAVGQS